MADTQRNRLQLGTPVRCADGDGGELADVVIDPVARCVTHLVVAPHGQPDEARLVPIAWAQGGDANAIALTCSVAELAGAERIQESAYLRLGESPTTDPAWDVGVEEVFALPYYEAADGFMARPVDPDPHAVWRYDRVPKGQVEIRRASIVRTSDDHDVGHVDGLIVDADGHVGAFTLERGHLWGKREVAIPIGAVAEVRTDLVLLRLTKDEVGDLPSQKVHRHG